MELLTIDQSLNSSIAIGFNQSKNRWKGEEKYSPPAKGRIGCFLGTLQFLLLRGDF